MDQNETMVIIRTMRHVLWTLVTKVMLNGHSWHIKCERYLRQFYVQKSPTQRPLPFSLFHFCTCVTWAVTSESKYDFTLFNCKMIHLNLAYIIWIKVHIMCGLHSSISIKQCRFIIYLFKVHYVCIRENRIHYRSSCIQKKNPKEAQHSFDHSSTGYQFSK